MKSLLKILIAVPIILFSYDNKLYGQVMKEETHRISNLPVGDQIHIQKYLSANCFGDYYTRNGLDIKTRELLTYSMLISMGGTESQVKGRHIQGNINVGNYRETLLSVTTQLLPYIGYPRTLNAIKCINEVTKK